MLGARVGRIEFLEILDRSSRGLEKMDRYDCFDNLFDRF